MKTISFILLPVSFIICVGMSFFNYIVPSALLYITASLFLINGFFFITSKNVFFYSIKRLGGACFSIFVITSLTFLLLRTLPGGPFDEERALPPAVKQNILEKYHLDKPVYHQYVLYLKQLIKGDLGISYKYPDRNVSSMLQETLPISMQLGLYCLILSFLLGIPFGVFAASKHNTFWDRVTMITAISGVALPSFLVAPVMILFFGHYFQWFPVALWEGPSYYILPILVLGTRPISMIARLTRTSVLDTLHSDYIRTAQAKGLHPIVILYKHVLKNAFIPVLTYAGPLVAFLLTGSFIVEQIFAIPGMSKHLILSVTNRDYPLVLGVTLVYCFVVIMANLIVDLLYSYFDPRIRLA